MSKKYFSVYYDGEDLAEIVTGFTGVARHIGSGWSNILDDKDFISNTIDSKKISVDFYFEGSSKNLAELRRKVAFFLNKDKPVDLSFSDEPNIIYQAVVDGEVSFDEGFDYGYGKITFLVPSGYGGSSFTNVLNNSNSGGALGEITSNTNGSATISINNKGTLPAYLRAKVSTADENGFVRIVGENGILEMGNVAEVDGVDLIKSELFLNAVKNVSSDYADFKATTRQYALAGTNRPNNGTIAYQTDGLRLANAGTGTGWHQGAWEFVLPKDSNGNLGASSFITNFNAVFETGSIKQMGYLHVMLTDDNDNVVMGYAISKTSATNNKATVNFYYQDVDNVGQFISYSTRPTFEAHGVNVKLNPGFFHTQGHAEMTKQGAQLGWLYNGKKYTLNLPELKDAKVTKIHVELGAYGTAPKMGNMALRRIWLQKTNVQMWSDIPNRFKAGSVLQADMEAGKIYLDDRPAMDLKVNGSSFFSIPPGESELLISGSDWLTSALDLQLEWEERYL
ncbi:MULTISPECIES: distal tail protein Dit [unclassified Lactococcus]|uniref:distal tail protein Dit n=1 Tax=unclassified Lactococcus TaxID=2643510 RepID=UPI0011CA75F5|nr:MULTISPECIES: distal tail protein Dit [unclassified Lactococcus]MQW22940.1 hypothetical protein [Lactococcus sp. dk101]TXK44513.1 hypothetical protein FVP42_04475 [Lactococcus sp. dk310]TXK50366.1 hypothetical protein FVP43_04445 [Lactococcus sp. dk322]